MQYIHGNKRLYIQGEAVKWQDVFIWFITLLHHIHEHLASGEGGVGGLLLLSSLTLYSMALDLRGKRRREREEEEERDQAYNGNANTTGTSNIKVYMLDTTKTQH